MPFYERDGVRIHYEEAGSGFPLLLIVFDKRVSTPQHIRTTSLECFFKALF